MYILLSYETWIESGKRLEYQVISVVHVVKLNSLLGGNIHYHTMSVICAMCDV